MPTKKKKFDSKFSTAKIKKIMQLDENIGKVASTVPVVMSKALEMFLQNFLLDAVHANLKHQTKTLSPQLLKEVTTKDPKWHFLSKVMAPIADLKPATKASRRSEPDYPDHSSVDSDGEDDVDSSPNEDPASPESQTATQTHELNANKRMKKSLAIQLPPLQNLREEIMTDLKKLTGGLPITPSAQARSSSLSTSHTDKIPPVKYNKSHSIDTIMGLYSPESCFYSDPNNKMPIAKVEETENDSSPLPSNEVSSFEA